MYALSIAVGILSVAVIGLAFCVCMKRRRSLERKSSNEELNRQGYNPDTDHVEVVSEELDELEDRVHFIRSRRVVGGVKTGFGENIENVGFVDSDASQEESNTPAILHV